MTDLATLSLAIDSRPAVEAADAIDRLSQSAQTGQSRTGQFLSSVDALIAALDRNTQAAGQLATQFSAVQAAGARTSAVVREVSAASTAATNNVVRLTAATTGARAGFDAAAASATKLRAAWADLSAQGASTLQNLERMQKLAASSASTPGFTPRPAANQNVAGGGGSDEYRNMILQNIAFQGKDFFEQAITGGSPLRAAITQAPQVATLMQMGGLGIGDVASGLGDKLKGLGEGAVNIAARLGIAGGAVGAFGAAVLVAAAAAQSYASGQLQLARDLAGGGGRLSGANVDSINRIALAGGGGLSTGARRGYAGQLAGAGVDASLIGGLLGTVKDYAATTGQGQDDALASLGRAFADPTKGAETLSRQLGTLDAATLENIQRLQAQGDKLGAARLLADAYSGSLAKASDLTTGWGRITEAVGERVGTIWDTIGRKVDGALTGGSVSERMAALRQVLDTPVSGIESALGGRFSARPALQREYDDLAQRDARQAELSNRAQQVARSSQVDALVRSASPDQERLKQLDDSAKNIRDYFRENWIDPQGEAKGAMEGFQRAARAMREDMSRGGQELAASLRQAQFAAGQVGRSGIGATEAQIRFGGQEAINRLDRSTMNPDEYAKAVATQNQITDTQVSAARREAIIAESQRSGLINRVPSNLRGAYLDAAAKTGVPLDFLLGTSYVESGFRADADANKNDPRSHAYGPMQLQPGTARQLGVDPRDPAQNILGGARYLRQMLDQANGDQALAYGLYHDGPASDGNSAAARSAYARIQRFQNMPTTAADIQAEDQRARALDAQNKSVQTQIDLAGLSGEKLDAAQRYQSALNDAVARGNAITPEFTAGLKANADAMAAANRRLITSQAGKDLEFERDQLGRDRYTQTAFSQARSRFGDTDSAEAQLYIGRARDTAELADVRSTLSDTGASFVSALSRGTSAAQAFSNALSRIGDKLISSAFDSLTGSLFGGKGGGGLLSGIGSLFGFANGGIMTGRGALPLHTYATGGVASSPQMAIFGEGRTPEAYVPLPDGRRIPVAMSMPANGNSVSSSTTDARQYNIDLRGSTLSHAEVQTALQQAIAANNAEQRRTQFDRQKMDRRAFG